MQALKTALARTFRLFQMPTFISAIFRNSFAVCVCGCLTIGPWIRIHLAGADADQRVDCLGFTESFHRYTRADSHGKLHSRNTDQNDRVLILMYATSYQNTQVAGAEGADVELDHHFRMYLGLLWHVESRGGPARACQHANENTLKLAHVSTHSTLT